MTDHASASGGTSSKSDNHLTEIITIIVDEVVDAIEDFDEVGPENVISLVTRVMEAAEKRTELSGEDKEDAVLHAIKEILARVSDDKPWKAPVLASIDLLGAGIIDQVVAASKGELWINKIDPEDVARCCGGFWSCFTCGSCRSGGRGGRT